MSSSSSSCPNPIPVLVLVMLLTWTTASGGLVSFFSSSSSLWSLLLVPSVDAFAAAPPPSNNNNNRPPPSSSSSSSQRRESPLPNTNTNTNSNSSGRNQRSNNNSNNGNRRSNTAADRNRKWYTNRRGASDGDGGGGIQTKKRRKRPPKWEIEGDALFLLVEDAIERDASASPAAGGGGDSALSTRKKKKKKKTKKGKGKGKEGEDTVAVKESRREDLTAARRILQSAFGKPSSKRRQRQSSLPPPVSTTITEKEEETEEENLKRCTIKQLKEQIKTMDLIPPNTKTSHLRLKADIIHFILQQQQQQKQSNPKPKSTTTTIPHPSLQTLLPPPPPPNPNQNQNPSMWGPCSVGPILKHQLLTSSFLTPTPIQSAAFTVISSRQRPNVVLASPTGTGKTLAYLLPILSVTERVRVRPGGDGSGSGSGGNVRVMIITPTIELAYQIQTVVDRLWPPPPLSNLAKSSSSATSATGPSSLYVVGGRGGDMETVSNEIRRDQSSLVAGTAKAMNGLLSYCSNQELEEELLNGGKGRKAKRRSKKTKGLFSNLEIIVLDEADRLLRTEQTARLQLQRSRMNRDAAASAKRRRQSFPPSSSQSSPSLSPTHNLLHSLTRTHPNLTLSLSSPPPPNYAATGGGGGGGGGGMRKTLQLICVSATVGRTLRRQIMDLTEAPSIDGAATLICGEGDGRLVVGKRKNQKKKKRQGGGDGDEEEEDGEEEMYEDEEEEEVKRRRSLLPGEELLRHAYVLHDVADSEGGDSSDDGMVEDRIGRTIRKTMEKLPPAPCLIFPGKDGVTRVCDFLSSPVVVGDDDGGQGGDGGGGGCGFENVRTLRGKYVPTKTTIQDNEDKDENSESPFSPSSSSSKSYSSWNTTPIYVIGERFARGLDLPDVQYVLISTPPTSGALYAHLAGRTGRKRNVRESNGEGGGGGGVAITMVGSERESRRLVALAKALGGLNFCLVDELF